MRKIVVTVVVCLLFCSVLSFPVLAEDGEYEKAVRAYLKKDYAGAVTFLKACTARKPDSSAYYLLGYAYYKLKNREESARYFRETYQLDPNFSPRKISFPGKIK